uniref:Fe2OG dioxygenase domain-containing protein n=1 Tax=Haemonchus contortus TaxID=6289 RepID=A0A7I4YS00_HAECO
SANFKVVTTPSQRVRQTLKSSRALKWLDVISESPRYRKGFFGNNAMIFNTVIVSLLLYSIGGDVADAMTPFLGDEYWHQDDLDLCETPGRLNESLFCYTNIYNYQKLDVEVLSEDPILIIYRNFAPATFVADFLADARRRQFDNQLVVDHEKQEPDSFKTSPSRRVNGTWFEHEETSGVAKMFRRVQTMLPFVNLMYSEQWQVLSYVPGGHYAPHYDLLNYASAEQLDAYTKVNGDRFATFLLMLQPATQGGGTVFPYLGITVMPSPGDAVFWTNMNVSREKEFNSLHGGCAIWEGEKIASTLWIRAKDQDLLQSPLQNGKLDIRKLIRPRLEYMGVTPIRM